MCVMATLGQDRCIVPNWVRFAHGVWKLGGGDCLVGSGRTHITPKGPSSSMESVERGWTVGDKVSSRTCRDASVAAAVYLINQHFEERLYILTQFCIVRFTGRIGVSRRTLGAEVGMGRPGGPGRAHDGPSPWGIPDEPGGDLGLAGLADTVLATVTADDMRKLLQTYPPRLRRGLLVQVGLRDGRKVSLGTSEAVLRTLRSGESRRRGALQDMISSSFAQGFGNADGLTSEDCCALLEPAAAAEVLDRAPVLRGSLLWESPVSIQYWCLARVAELNRPLAPVALGLMAAEPTGLGDGADVVAAAWRTLCERHPGLPERPIGLLDLQELARRRPTGPPSTDQEIDTSMTSDVTGETSPGASADRWAELEEAAAALENLRGGLPVAAGAADRVAAALHVGRRPEDDDVALIGEVVANFDTVLVHAEAVASGTSPACDLASLSAALETARQAETRAARVRALVGVQGPDMVAGPLEEVRRMARAGGSDGLDVFAELIEVASRKDSFQRAAELAEKAREQLPETCRMLVDAALMGHLTIVPLPGEGAESIHVLPVDETEGDPRAGVVEGDPGSTEAADDEAVSAGAPAARDEAANPPETNDDGSADDDLAGLDALIAETFPEERPTTSVPGTETAGGDPLAEAEPGVVDVPSGPVTLTASESFEPEPLPDEAIGKADESGPCSDRTASAVLAPQLAEAEAAALRAGRLGLAGLLRSAVGRPGAEEAARRCAAIAAEMSVFAGPLSAEFAAAASEVSAEDLADDPAGRLLAWGAAVKAGLVHPTPESTRLLEELTGVVPGFPGLVECGEAFIGAARSGAYLGSGVPGRARGAAESTMIRRQAVREASRQLEEERHRKIKYQLGTEVWKALLKRDEPIGRLLTIAAQDDPVLADEAATEITRLRASGEIDRLLDETARRIAARRRTKKIIAGARNQLVVKVKNAVDTVGEWVRAVKEAEIQEAAGAQDWRLGPLGQLQESIGANRHRIIAGLDGLATPPDDVLAAAAEVTRGLLVQTFDLLDGAPVPETEPALAHVINRDLLLAAEIALDPVSFEPLQPPTVEQLVPVAFADDRGWRAAFEQRAERGDHEGTLGIVMVLERLDPETAVELRRRRDELIPQARAAKDARIDEVRNLVADWARDGALTENEIRRADEALDPLTGDRRDFDQIERSLDELLARLEEWRRSGIERERARLDERARDDSRVAAVRDRIAERIEQGDLTTAREFLAQVEAGKQLHEPPEGIDHLQRFYPAFPRAFAAGAGRAGNRARKQETSEFLTELMDALRAGRDVDDPDLAELLQGAGIGIPALRNARREEAREGLRQWKACGLGSKTAGNLRTAITPILRMIGLEGVQGDAPVAPGGSHRIWIDLEQVRMVGKPLLPAFGSRMSPSGDRLRLLLVWRRPGPQQLIELLKGQPEDQTVLVWYFGVLSPEERQQLAAAARRRPAPVAGVLDDVAISYLACMPEADWATTVTLMAPFTATNPYAPIGDVPDEMFYGRDAQLREVTDRTGSSFVYGGRQLGKSALLRKAERHIRATDPARTVILENIQTVGKVTPPERLWARLADKLAHAGLIPTGLAQREQVREALREWALNDPQRQVLILLDEADHFLNEDAKGAVFENVTQLRDLMDETGRRVKVVFAGLHQTARFQSLTNQPLAHLGTPIAVGPLEPQDAFDLLVEPLATLGFRFPETLAARVIAEANNAPALVQLFAEELLTRLRRNPNATRRFPYEITHDDVVEVWRDKALARGFRDRFEWTLNLDKRYKVIAYTVALHALTYGADATLSVGELAEQCRYWWEPGFEDCGSDDFRSLLDECVNLGVLGLDADRYRLRTPHILNLLGGASGVEDVLQNAGEFEKPDSFHAHSYRGVFHNGPERSPLSSRQLTSLFRPHDLVHVVAGSRALHGERVAAALQQEEIGHPGVKVHLVGPGQLTFDGAVGRADRHDGHTVIVVNVPEGKTEQQFARRLDEARRAVASPRNGTLAVVLVTGVQLACVWRDILSADGVDLVELRRFDRLAIRQWMWEDSHGFPDEAGQEALLAETGGWPTLIGQVVNRLADSGGDRDQALGQCREQLLRNPGEFVADTGVQADECLAAAWQVLVMENTPDTPEELADLLDLHGEETVPALSEPALKEHGYSGTADLVEALRLLGALEPREGRLSCEPVLAEATRRSGTHG